MPWAEQERWLHLGLSLPTQTDSPRPPESILENHEYPTPVFPCPHHPPLQNCPTRDPAGARVRYGPD